MHGLGNSSEFHRHFIVFNRRFIGIYRYFSVGVLFIDIVVPECRYLSVLECHCEQRVVDEGSRVGEELEGYDCKVDVTHFVLTPMSRIGEVLSNLYLWSSLSSDRIGELLSNLYLRSSLSSEVALSPYYEHESDGYHILKPTACVEVIDILHSVFRVVTLLMSAKPVGAASAEHMPVETASFP